MPLPPAMMFRAMGIDPKAAADMQKAMGSIDFKALDTFIKELPLMMERVERIDAVFQHMVETESNLETAVKVVYGSDEVRGGV